MQKTKTPVVWVCAITIVLGGILTGKIFAQKSDKEIRQEYRTSVSQYIQGLDESFAYRYLDNELILVDLIATIQGEYKYRKGKKLIKPSGDSKLVLPLSRDSIRAKLRTVRDNLDLMKAKNYLMPGYTSQAGLNELHMEFQKLYGMDHELTRVEALGVRDRLIKSGDNDQVRSFFNRQLKQAFKRYKEGNYSVAAIEFKDITTTYKTFFNEWDDIIYYLGESYYRMKDFGSAEESFSRLVSEYPSSAFVERSLGRLVIMSYVLTDRNKMQKYFTLFESKVSSTNKKDTEYNLYFYLAGLTLFRTSDYTACIAIINKIPKTSRYYFPGKYLIAHAYANSELYAEATEQFELVANLTANNKGFSITLQNQLKDLAQLKLAFLKFEMTTNGQKLKAVIPHIQKIPRASEIHDAGLLALSWSALKDNQIDSARIYVDSLIHLYPGSDYYYEAKTLLGNIQVLDPTLSDKDRELLAVDAYNYVAGATEAKYLADQYIAERDASRKVLEQLDEARMIARLRNDSVAFVKYERLYGMLEKAISNNGFQKAISKDKRSAGYYKTMSDLISKIRITEGKLKSAQDKKDQPEINKLNKELTGYLNDFQAVGGEKFLEQAYASGDTAASSGDIYSSIETQGYFSLHKVPRALSEIEARNKSMNALKEKISREKEMNQNQLGTIDNMIVTAKEKNREAALVKLQYERNKLADLYYRLSDYEVMLYAEDPIENYVDLDTWGDFASYGRNNITYVINTTKNETIKDLARAAAQIDKILITRKKNYESRIAAIEEEIKLKEQEIRDKELKDMRASQKQFFEKEFFQAKSTEKPEVDPFDYKDLVPEVIVIPKDTVKEAPAEVQAAEEEEAEPAAQDTAAAKTDTEVENAAPIENKAPEEKVQSDSASGEENVQSDSTSGKIEEGSGGGEMSWYLELNRFKERRSMYSEYFPMIGGRVYHIRNHRSFVES